MTEAARLRIEPVMAQAKALQERVAHELPTHDGLGRVTTQLADAAFKAQRIAASMKRPWSPHRLPVVFLASAIVGLLGLVWWEFGHVSSLSLALPDRDASELRSNLQRNTRLDVHITEVPGSREAVQLLERGEVDLGFVQGGLAIPPGLLRLEIPTRELVLFFVRDGVTGPAEVKKVMTSVQGEGSHSVAQAFFAAWEQTPTFLHEWPALTGNADLTIPADVDAVLVVKDPGDEKALRGALRLSRAGFHLSAPSLGARAGKLDYLTPTVIPAGYLHVDPAVPAEPIATYSVSTWLVAREGLTPRLLTQAAEVLESRPTTISERSFHLSGEQASELLQGVDALFSIIVNIGLAFLALLGLDVIAYRKQFHELNSLVSLLSMLQANKDVLGVEGPERRENLLYLSLCSDALSLISVVSGYYTQENSSLLFNNLSEVVHQRCDALKLNIQLKLLHGMVPA